MEAVIAADPRSRERIFPYIGGEELNDSPDLSFRRWVIGFGNMSETEARRWPELMDIVERRVRPYRMTVNREAHRRYWWQYGDKRPELTRKQAVLPRVLVNAQVSPNLAFAFQPTDRVFAMMLNVFLVGSWAGFCVLQARVHEVWARFLGSSMKDDLRYTPTDCFETFPFPVDLETNAVLEAAGWEYYEFRAALMVQNNEGLTKTYNRFHDSEEASSDILRLRELHANMDRAVLDAYGWTDIQPACEFLLDYEEDEEEGRNKKKKPWRYRWPDDVRDEVLARLLKLNAERAEEERLAGLEGLKEDASKARARRKVVDKPTKGKIQSQQKLL
jgi:PAS domain-containing protein